jgi:hypothetical protein
MFAHWADGILGAMRWSAILDVAWGASIAVFLLLDFFAPDEGAWKDVATVAAATFAALTLVVLVRFVWRRRR